MRSRPRPDEGLSGWSATSFRPSQPRRFKRSQQRLYSLTTATLCRRFPIEGFLGRALRAAATAAIRSALWTLRHREVAAPHKGAQDCIERKFRRFGSTADRSPCHLAVECLPQPICRPDPRYFATKPNFTSVASGTSRAGFGSVLRHQLAQANMEVA